MRFAGTPAIMVGVDGVSCFHSGPPAAGEALAEDLETVGMVVCAHVIGVGVYLAEEDAWGHVNTPALMPGADGKIVLPSVGASDDQHRLAVDALRAELMDALGIEDGRSS